MVSTYYRATAQKRDIEIVEVGIKDVSPPVDDESRSTAEGDPEDESRHGPKAGLEKMPVARDNRESPRDRITGSEIRLLKLYPGNEDDDLVANIELYSFRSKAEKRDRRDEPREATKEGKTLKPHTIVKEMPEGFKYEALSYTWGENKIVGAIQILEGDKRFEIKIRQNLLAALKTLRRLPRVRRVRDEAYETLRNEAIEDSGSTFRRLKKQVNKDLDGKKALDWLRILLPEANETSLKELIEDIRASRLNSSMESETIEKFVSMVSNDLDEDEDESLVRWLWIDAICIDQADHDEKSRQIPRMSDIYMGADNVCVWLGEELFGTDTDSSLAMDFVEEVLNGWEEIPKILHNKEREWNAFITLIRRPWFSRRWIVQEITRSRKATIYCGQKKVDWDKFADVISLLKQYQLTLQDLFKRSVQLGNDPERMGDLDELSAIRLVHASDHLFRRNKDEGISEKLLPLEGLMSTLTAFDASEPKDIVYAIVWLAQDAVPVSKEAFTLSSGIVAQSEEIVDQVERHASRRPSFSGANAPSRRTSPPPLIPISSALSEELNLGDVNDKLRNIRDQNHAGNAVEVPQLRVDQPSPRHEQLQAPGGGTQHLTFVNPFPNTTKMDDDDAERRDIEERMKKAGVKDITPEEFARRWKSLKDLMSMLKYKRFIIDYEKSLFDVCYDFLRFCVERSGRLDLLCRPWAPEPTEKELHEHGQLPSWVRRLSEHGTFSKLYGGPMERINADPLVGRPGTGEKRFYTADRGIRATFKTIWDKDHMRYKDRKRSEALGSQDWMSMLVPPEKSHAAGEQRRCLIVRGFVIDSISHVYPAALGGTIPLEWLVAVNWTDAKNDPLDDNFWRMLVGNRDLSGDRAPALWKRACQQVFKKRVQGGDLNVKRQLLQSQLSEPIRHFLKRVESMVFRRSLLELRYSKMYAEQEAKEKEQVRKEEVQGFGKGKFPLRTNARSQSSPVLPKQIANSFTAGPTRASTSVLREHKSRNNDEAKLAKGDNRLALGPCDAQEGDIIAIIFGCSVPVVLRKVQEDDNMEAHPWVWKSMPYDFKLPRQQPPRPDNETSEDQMRRSAQEEAESRREERQHEHERFQLIGECYVHGNMDGEAWTMPNIFREIRRFTIV